MILTKVSKILSYILYIFLFQNILYSFLRALALCTFIQKCPKFIRSFLQALAFLRTFSQKVLGRIIHPPKAILLHTLLKMLLTPVARLRIPKLLRTLHNTDNNHTCTIQLAKISQLLDCSPLSMNGFLSISTTARTRPNRIGSRRNDLTTLYNNGNVCLNIMLGNNSLELVLPQRQ